MKRLLLAALVVLALIPACTFAQEESEAKKIQESTGVTERGSEVFWGWLNFLLLAGGLGYLVKKNGGPFFARRSLEIRKGLAEAHEVQTKAESQVAEVERRLANLGAEIEALRQSARQEAEAEAARVRREIEDELAKIQTHLGEELAGATKSARLELRRYSGELAISLAEKKIAARMSPATQDHLVREFVAAMGQVPAHSN